MTVSDFQSLTAVARGDVPADLVFENARIMNTLSSEIEEGSVAVFGGRIAGIGDYRGAKRIDLKGRYLCPSFIDGHIHIESSLLLPGEFARAVVPWGTGAVICDPHEIVNVCGIEGISCMLRATENLPLDVFMNLPSCVPATDMETSGACLCAEDLQPLYSHARVLGLAEVMCYPSVIAGEIGVLQKIESAGRCPIDGHSPGVRGLALNAYCAVGISSDHECTTIEEAREKLRRGMLIQIREGSTARNLEALLPLVTAENAHRFCFVSDDRHADEIQRVGHMNAILAKAVKLGLNPLLAIRMATLHTAQHYGLAGIGAIAPGYKANVVVLEDLNTFRALSVWHSGELVAEDGDCVAAIPEVDDQSVRDTMHLPKLSLGDFAIPAGSGRVRVIEIIPDQIVTLAAEATLPVREGRVESEIAQDIIKLVVVERFGRGGGIGKGFVKGFGMKSGAIASTVAHDSHNIVCAGVSDEDILTAVRRTGELGGGLVIASQGRILAELALPVAGLMCDLSASQTSAALAKLHDAAASLGCTLHSPFMALAFLALPVIPHLKLTDMGLIDVDRFIVVGLEIS